MHKTLFKFGNGMAIVIDASIRRQLGIGLETPLHMSRQGTRIVIERSTCDAVAVAEQPRVATHSSYDVHLLTTLMRELDAYGLTRVELARLSHDQMSLFAFFGLVTAGASISAITVARLEAFLEKLQARMQRDEAIALVLGEIPDDLHRPSLRAS